MGHDIEPMPPLDELEQFQKDMQDTHERLKGATVEYHKESIKTKAWIDLEPNGDMEPMAWGLWDNANERIKALEDDRYILHGVLARLTAACHTEGSVYERRSAYYDTVNALVITLTAYLSQG